MNNAFSKNNSLVLSGRKASNVRSIIYALCLSSPCTTRDLAKFSLQRETTSKAPSSQQEIRNREQMYYKLIQGRMRKKTGRKKGDKYPGLVENGYVIATDEIINKKNKKVNVFTLTFRGLLFALGFNFDVIVIQSFLENNSKNNLLCAYLYLIMKNTSLEFVKKRFLGPVYSLINENRILLDSDLGFYFINISQAIGSSLINEIEQLHENNMKEVNSMIDITEKLMNKTFYDLREFNSWEESIIEHFYKSESDWIFYNKFSDSRDARLLYEVIKSIINGYYFAIGFEAPRKPKNNLSLSSGLKEHRRHKNKVKSKKV